MFMLDILLLLRPVPTALGTATRGLLPSATAPIPTPRVSDRRTRVAPTGVAILGALAALAATPALGQTRMLRYPDLHGDTVVFSYAGDLWSVSDQGGRATRLTAHPGLELFPKFSPDGSMIAFTGQYDGDEQVYVIPATGGVPKQLTYYPARGPLPARWGYDHQVMGWTPDGKSILFRSLRDSWTIAEGRLYTVPVGGGPAKPLPPPSSGAATFSPDGSRLFYSPLARDFRTWKRYQGGWAQNLFIIDLKTLERKPIAHTVRTERDPMWFADDTLAFNSDRSGTFNLYKVDPATNEVVPLTRSTTWDVRWPSQSNDGRIVYEFDGTLRIVTVSSGEDRGLTIEVPDDGLTRRPERVSAAGLIEDFGLSPKGERALFAARGEVFTVPIENGTTRALVNSSKVHAKAPIWSPDGSTIAYLSDASGEEELWLVAQDGSKPPRQLTHGGRAMRFAPRWSPDGSAIAFVDKDGKLLVADVATGNLVEAADSPEERSTDHVWSPDSRFLAFSLPRPNGNRALFIWSRDAENPEAALQQITDEFFNAFEPAWDPEGNYLYYLANHDFAPQISAIEWNYAGNLMTCAFALALRKDVPHPFPPRSDEVTIEAQPDINADKPKDDPDKPKDDPDKPKDDADKTPQLEKSNRKVKPIRIDFDGLAQRVARVPIESGNLRGLAATSGHLVFARTPPFFYGRPADSKPSLRVFDLKERKEATLAEDVAGYALSNDGKKALIRQGAAFGLFDVSTKGAASKKPVSTAGLMVERVPVEEWEQIFDEVWRRYRDFFYVENMHGYDWAAIRDQYRPLLKDVAHRADLNHLMGEMISELNVGHAYVTGGDLGLPARPKVALLGARLTYDEMANAYRISRILPGQNQEPLYRSPLTEVGVNVEQGEFLLAIDGQPLKADEDPYRLLKYKADRPVKLTVGPTADPSGEGVREVTITPIDDESNLLYLEWVERNRRKVAELSDGKVGYIHIPDMIDNGIREFIKTFYPQIRKQGLVIDVRYNGGGNVSQMLLERLRRELLGTRFSRTGSQARTYPNETFHGHLVCLLNENSASDGDIFPARFRKAKLGPLIGKRSWGGVVGITSHGPLIDGGTVNVPEFSTNDVDGSYIIEGEGVVPDIEVENDPASLVNGSDPQLERGVVEVLKRIAEDPRVLPSKPADPVKTKAPVAEADDESIPIQRGPVRSDPAHQDRHRD